MKKSMVAISKDLSEEQKEKFSRAIMYFSMGGDQGNSSIFKMIFSESKPDPKLALARNVLVIDGLTGEEILKKFDERQLIDKQMAKERENLASLKDEANKLLESHEFESALAKYEEMSQIPSGLTVAEQGVAEVKQAMESFTEKMAYIDNVEITEFVAKRIDAYLKNGVPAVRISLKNRGQRSLDKVNVIVYFQDQDSNTIFEKDYNPVLVSQYSFGNNNKPLKPGYVKEMERGQFYTLDSALSEWEEGKAFAKVVDIEFSEG